MTALIFGFLLAGQLRLQLIPQSNPVERNAALVRSVKKLEATNSQYRNRVATLRHEVAGLESAAAGRSAAAQTLKDQIDDLRAHAGLTRLSGPGVAVVLSNGTSQNAASATANLVTFQDVQDVVNLLFAAGAEGVGVNGQRITPMSALKGSGAEVVVDQGPPLSAPFTITGLGDRNQMQDRLNDSRTLGDIRHRESLNEIQLSWSGSPDLSLPAYDGVIEVEYAHAG